MMYLRTPTIHPGLMMDLYHPDSPMFPGALVATG
jgi:hypothetical protein